MLAIMGALFGFWRARTRGDPDTQYLVEHGTALAVDGPDELRRGLDGLLRDARAYDAMQRAAAREARPDAAASVVERLAVLTYTTAALRRPPVSA